MGQQHQQQDVRCACKNAVSMRSGSKMSVARGQRGGQGSVKRADSSGRLQTGGRTPRPLPAQSHAGSGSAELLGLPGSRRLARIFQAFKSPGTGSAPDSSSRGGPDPATPIASGT